MKLRANFIGSTLVLLLLSTVVTSLTLISLKNKTISCQDVIGKPSGFLNPSSESFKQSKAALFFSATGVCPRQAIILLEGAKFLNDESGSTFTLSDGTLVPPLDYSTFKEIQKGLPADKRRILDEKFFWLLQTNPALPMIASGLAKGEYLGLVSGDGVFNTNTYYKDELFQSLFDAASTADVEIEELIPLLEIHFITQKAAYFDGLEDEPEGVIKSFDRNEIDLTNKQYFLRYLIQTPMEGLIRVFAIDYVERVKAEYVLSTTSPDISTTISLGRLPLPTPTAAEDTPGAHALAIANASQQGIHLFPPSVEIAASKYQRKYKETLELKQTLATEIKQLAEQHDEEIIKKINYFKAYKFWQSIGISRLLNLSAVSQLDTSRNLGIYATRHEGLAPNLKAHESYRRARHDLINYHQENPLELSYSERLNLFFNDQALNNKLWITLERQAPDLKYDFRKVRYLISQLEKGYRETAALEAAVFYELQQHDLDISTDAFALLSVAMARRLSDLAYLEFKPSDRKNAEYLMFIRGIFPFQRDMPDMNVQWGDGWEIKRYGLENYLVPDLMAFNPRDAPMLSAIANLHYHMVKAGDLKQWDFENLIKLISTACNLSVGKNPATLPSDQVDLLPLVAKYRSELKQISGADGLVGTSILHGLALQDYRIEAWPEERKPSDPENLTIINQILATMTPHLSKEKQQELTYILTRGSSELSLSLKLVLQHDPKFLVQSDGRLDLVLRFQQSNLWKPCIRNSCYLRVNGINRNFQTIYSPMYMTRIVLPSSAREADAHALNQIIAKSRAIYGGFTPKELSLPRPLQAIP